MTTVNVAHLNEYAVKMVWASRVNDTDVKQSFKAVDAILTSAGHPMFVVVDITADPNFPISATLTGALFGPYRNPNLREWLIIGSNTAAKFIERTLSAATGRTIVRWFATDAEAAAFITQASESAA